MAGTFVGGARPVLPGEYTDFIALGTPTVQPSPGQIVAIAGVHDWGPYNVPTLCVSYADFVAKFGGSDTDLRRAVFQAFFGEGVGGKGGASGVVACRMGLSSGIAAATVNLQNTTPAAALTLTAIYRGTKGNNITVTTQAAAISGYMQLLVLLNGAVVEKYQYPQTNIANLASQINSASSYLTATSTITGVALAAVSGTALTGGNDGTAIVGADYTATMAALAAAPGGVANPALGWISGGAFRVVAFANLTDPTITTAVVAWTALNNTSGLRHTLVLGGAAGESVSAAETAAAGLNNENVVRLGVGTITDSNLLPSASVSISTAQGAPRVAGVIAARGERMDLVMARFAGWSLQSDAAGPSDQAAAPGFGLTVLSQDGRFDAPVRIAQGCTTFTIPTGSGDPRNPVNYRGVNVYGVVKYMSIMHGFEMDLQASLEQADGNIGELNVNDHTRLYLIGRGRALATDRAKAGIIQPDPTVIIDTSTFGPPSDDQDFIAVLYGFQFSPSLRQVFNSVAVNV